MFRKSMKWRVPLIGATITVLVAAGSAVALATGSSNANVYAGCLSAGKLYNVHLNPAHAVHCRHRGQAISWNQTGPAGSQGPTGPAGSQGPTGPAGLQGAGGPAGPRGATGATGAQGPQGIQGQQCIQGLPGTAGTNGNTVLNGAGAPSTQTGKTGDFYLDTVAHAIYGPRSASSWGNPTSLVGPQGTPGSSPTLSATTKSYPVSVPNGDAASLIEACPSGDVDTGGGGGFTTAATGLVIEQSQPFVSGTTPAGWQMIVLNTSGSTQTFNLYLICLPTSAQNGAVRTNGTVQTSPTVHLSPIKP